MWLNFSMSCLNPCYNGIKMKGVTSYRLMLSNFCLNSCYNGIKMKDNAVHNGEYWP